MINSIIEGEYTIDPTDSKLEYTIPSGSSIRPDIGFLCNSDGEVVDVKVYQPGDKIIYDANKTFQFGANFFKEKISEKGLDPTLASKAAEVLKARIS